MEISRWRDLIDASPLEARFRGARLVLVADVADASGFWIDEDFARALGASSAPAFRGQFAVGGSAAARRLKGMSREIPPSTARLVVFPGEHPLTLVCARVDGGNRSVFVVAEKGRDTGAARPTKAPAARAKRFLWRLDAHGRFCDVTPALGEALGGGPSAAETLADFVARRGLRGGEAWLDAWAQGASFQDLPLEIPGDGEAAPRRVTLSGARWRAGDASMGGFGHVVAEAAPEDATAPVPFETAVEVPPPSRPTASADDATSGAAGPEDGAALPESDSLPQNSEEAPKLASNVVPLRPGLAPGREEAHPQGEDAALTPDERSAFREIARALGARLRPPKASGASGGSEGHGPGGDFAALIDKLPVGVAVFRDQETLYANRTLLDLVGADDLVAFRANGGAHGLFADRAAAGGASAFTLPQPGGEAIPVEARAAVVAWDGRPATMIALRRSLAADARDLVAAAEAKARKQAERAASAFALLEGSRDAAFRLDRRGVIAFANAAAERIFGRSPESLGGTPFEALLPMSERDAFTAALARFDAPGAAATRFETEFETTGAAPRPVRLTLLRIERDREAPLAAYVADFSSERERFNAIETARAEAQRASQMKSETLARISHEIRTPLHAILGFVEVMLEQRFGPIGSERYKDYLKDIHASGQHVVSLANDLLDIGKIEAGKLDLNFAPVDANQVIRDCLALMQPQAAQEHVILRSSLNETLPSVLADERSLRQIILNLVSNAVKFNAPGGQVIVSTEVADGGQAVIRVRDTGLGMDEKELSEAMLPFTQVGPKRNGAGLGLPLTKALTEANHARFTIQSEKRQGTLVEIAFPARAAQ